MAIIDPPLNRAGCSNDTPRESYRFRLLGASAEKDAPAAQRATVGGSHPGRRRAVPYDTVSSFPKVRNFHGPGRASREKGDSARVADRTEDRPAARGECRELCDMC